MYISGKDAKQIRKFIEKFKNKVKPPMIIDMEKENKSTEIPIILAWKFLLRAQEYLSLDRNNL